MTIRSQLLTVLARCVVMSVLVISNVQASLILDQNYSPYGRYSLQARNYVIRQQVTADMSGVLAGVTLWDLGTDTVSIIRGTLAAPGTLLFQTTASLNYGVFVDTSAANILLNPGDQYFIQLSGGNIGCCTVPTSATVYAGNALDYGFGPTTQWTLAFQTFIDPDAVPVPEPGTFGLMLGSIVLLGLTLRRRKQQVQA